MSANMADQSGSGGLYAGFEGYRSPTADELRQVLTSGIVVPDTNLLLNLYRYTATARDTLLRALEKLEALWVPHQVLTEFWRNRETVLRDPGDAVKITKSLDAHRDKANTEVRAWANRVHLAPGERDALISLLDKGFEQVSERIKEIAHSSTHQFHRDTHQDTVLAAVEPILQGRVGPPMTAQAYKVAVTEGLRRIQAQEPPGYKDKKKDDANAVGDYLVWEQTLVEAASRRLDVLFVTSDTKEDWWRDEGGERRGPRIELVNEMRARCDTTLYMIRPAQLLELAKSELAVEVSSESVKDVDRVDAYTARRESPKFGGWTEEAVDALLMRLHAERPVQAAVLVEASVGSGFVSRDRVYEIAEYPPGRSLRGFTKPINRITQDLKDDGQLSEDAVDILSAVYSHDTPTQAAGFEIHSAVMPIFG
ncbi:PIN-like domain-containing protein [Actinokineospora globicatena]|nr:PIN-like domain-containing protein [Actinokineospora globicatena]